MIRRWLKECSTLAAFLRAIIFIIPPSLNPSVCCSIYRNLQVLAAFLKAIGFIIPLMDAMYANYYTREVMVILIR